jgi:hypothetical protein
LPALTKLLTVLTAMQRNKRCTPTRDLLALQLFPGVPHYSANKCREKCD